ncbi:MAG: ABC transporter substrate-binding protein [Candidatus Binatia bacterium]
MLRVCQEEGIFERCGLDIDIAYTRSSDELMGGLVDGKFEIVQAAPDNFIAWRDRTGADIVAWIGGSSGPISLVVQGDVKTIADLRGAKIAVDSPKSGWAPILIRLLSQAGLRNSDYDLVATGATQLVYKALLEKQAAATMLNLPWSILAGRSGCHVLADHRSAAPRLQTSCCGSLARWLAGNSDTADKFLRAVIAGVTWLYHPINRAAAARLLADQLSIDQVDAKPMLDFMTDPMVGWPPSGYVDAEGMRAVCALRTEAVGAPLHAAEDYVAFDPYYRVLGFGQLKV